MRGVKGQVTIFVIIGIVLLLSFVFIISMQQDSLNKKLDNQAKEAVTDFVELNSLNQYVTGCLDLVASDGLLLLGEQGGVLYEYQGGLTPSPNTSNGFVEGRDYMPHTFYRQERGNDPVTNESRVYLEKVSRNISYGVTTKVNCAAFKGPYLSLIDIEPTSYYPVKELFFVDYVSQFRRHYTNGGCYGHDEPYISISGFLGANKFPALCSYNGSNAFDPFARIAPCKPNQYDSNISAPSMQRQLESYVESNLGSCVNLSFFSQFSGSSISVNEENVEIKTTLLQPRGIVINAYYPVEVQVGDRTIIQQANFQTKLNTNVRQLYDFVSKLLIDYVRDPTFNLLEDWNSTSNVYYKESFKLFFYQAPCLDCQKQTTKSDYVLTIVDDSSTLKGRPWTINTAIQQRKPVLDYMNDPGQDSMFQGEKIDYQFFSNSTIRLEPVAIDPEFGNLTYNYFGWKEDFDTYLNWTNCTLMEGICNLSNYEFYVTRIDTPPHRWSTNAEFISSKRVSMWNTSYGDVGLHNVTVVVTDINGKKDFQIVRILIFDLPKAVLNLSNGYEDISNEWASIEDMYILNGSASQASMMAGGDIDSYIFWDDTEGFVIESAGSVVNISELFWNATLDFFREEILSGSNDNTLPVDHEILLIVKQNQTGVIIQSPPAVKNVTVAQCLPHGYEGTDSAFDPLEDYDVSDLIIFEGIYYYNTNDNLFDSPHVCCEPLLLQPSDPLSLGGGVFSQSDVVCFDKIFYLTLPNLDRNDPYPYLDGSFIDDGIGNTAKYNPVIYYLNSFPIVADPYSLFSDLSETYLRDDRVNNLFKLRMKQTCSGKRGNVCDGDFEFHWITPGDCNDFDDIPDVDNQFARCQGPGDETGPFIARRMNEDLSESFVDSELGCRNFSSGLSYEKKVLSSYNLENFQWTEDEADLIGQGFCAPPRAATISLEGQITINPTSNSGPSFNPEFPSQDHSYPFTCKANCNVDSGKCDYFELDQCRCTVTLNDPDNSCEDLLASKFGLIPGNSETRYFCKSGGACDSSCSIETVSSGSRAACYCATSNAGGSSFSDTEMDDDADFIQYFETNQLTKRCCSLTKTFTYQGNGEVCWNGQVKFDGEILSNNNLLVDDGLIYCCLDSNNHCSTIDVEGLFHSTSSGESLSGKSCSNGHWS